MVFLSYLFLQDKHPKEFNLYKTNKAVNISGKRGKKRASNSTTNDNDIDSEPASKKMKQVPIDLQMKYSSKKSLSQSDFEKELLKLLVRDMQPLSMVERTGFIQFCKQCLPNYTLIYGGANWIHTIL